MLDGLDNKYSWRKSNPRRFSPADLRQYFVKSLDNTQVFSVAFSASWRKSARRKLRSTPRGDFFEGFLPRRRKPWVPNAILIALGKEERTVRLRANTWSPKLSRFRDDAARQRRQGKKRRKGPAWSDVGSIPVSYTCEWGRNMLDIYTCTT